MEIDKCTQTTLARSGVSAGRSCVRVEGSRGSTMLGLHQEPVSC